MSEKVMNGIGIFGEVFPDEMIVARAIEAKLKEKNYEKKVR